MGNRQIATFIIRAADMSTIQIFSAATRSEGLTVNTMLHNGALHLYT